MDTRCRIRPGGSTKPTESRSKPNGYVLRLLLILGALCGTGCPVAAQTCSDGSVDSTEEDCDDGEIRIGGADAGTACTGQVDTDCDNPVLENIVPIETLSAQGESLRCVGDCSRDGAVTVDELIIGASIALGVVDTDSCVELDADRDDTVSVDEIVLGVMSALDGCPNATPVPTKTATPTPSATPGVCGQPVSDETMAACRAARTEASCLANGGEWRMSFIRNWYCACPTGVGGCPCTDSSECPCVAPLPDDPRDRDCERATVGSCLAQIPFDGCYCLFDSDGEAEGLCSDP